MEPKSINIWAKYMKEVAFLFDSYFMAFVALVGSISRGLMPVFVCNTKDCLYQHSFSDLILYCASINILSYCNKCVLDNRMNTLYEE